MEPTLLDIAPRVRAAIQSQAEGIGGLLGSAKTPCYSGSMLFVSFSVCHASCDSDTFTVAMSANNDTARLFGR